MKESMLIDLDGNIADVILVDDESTGVIPYGERLYLVAFKVQEGLHVPKWDFSSNKWTEGKVFNIKEKLNKAKEAKLVELKIACNQTIISGFTSSMIIASTNKAHTYGCDDKDQQNFTGKLAQLNANPDRLDWYFKTEDTQEFLLHTREEFITICNEAIAHIETNLGQCAILKKATLDAKSIEEVNLINWQV